MQYSSCDHSFTLRARCRVWSPELPIALKPSQHKRAYWRAQNTQQANGQTKEHAMLAKALGVNQLLVVVNKLDATDPPWSEERYEAVKAEVGPFLARTGFRPKKVRVLRVTGGVVPHCCYFGGV